MANRKCVPWQLDFKLHTCIETHWALFRTICLFTRLESLAWFQQGFWHPSLYRKCKLWSLCCDGWNRGGLLFIAFLEERECVEKIVRMKDGLVSTFFSMKVLKSNSTSVHLSQQRLQKWCFLQKLGIQKPCLDQARLSSLVNKQVGAVTLSTPISIFHIYFNLFDHLNWASHLLFLKGEQGTAELGANTLLKQTNELCF